MILELPIGDHTFVTIGASLIVSILGMLLTNALSESRRNNKMTEHLREIISGHVGGLHSKIDATTENLRMRIDGGLRVIDDKIDEHFKDDLRNFSAQRHETGEVGHALREKIREMELWGRDNFLLVKHFDDKHNQLVARLESQDRVSDARHETTVAGMAENRTAHSDVVKRLDTIERNGSGKH